MDVAKSTIELFASGAVAALALLAAAWLGRRPTSPSEGRASGWPVPSRSRSSQEWFGGDPAYFYGGHAASADCGATADGGAGCD